MPMTQTLEELSATLPAEDQQIFVDTVQDLAAQMELEAKRRRARVMEGFEQAKRGEGMTLEEWEVHSEKFMAHLKRKYSTV